MSWRRLQNALKTSWRCLDFFARRLGKMSWRCLKEILKTSSKCLEDALKMSWSHFCKTSWRRPENVLKRSWQDVLKKCWKCLEDVFWRLMIKANIFILIKTSWRRLEDVFWRQRRKTFSRRLHQVECLLGYHFYPLHEHLDSNRAITAESLLSHTPCDVQVLREQVTNH